MLVAEDARDNCFNVVLLGLGLLVIIFFLLRRGFYCLEVQRVLSLQFKLVVDLVASLQRVLLQH